MVQEDQRAGQTPQVALGKYCETRDDLQAVRQPRQPEELVVRELVHRFLTRAQDRLDRMEITAKTLDDHMMGDLIIELLGKTVLANSLRSCHTSSHTGATLRR